MMGLFLSAYDEERKEVTLEFVSIASVGSNKLAVLMNKVQEIFLPPLSAKLERSFSLMKLICTCLRNRLLCDTH